jgi:Ca2+-binding EF-hand superfamily protein
MSDEEIISCFKVLDTDKKGKISVDDLRHFLTTMGEPMSDSEFDQLVKDAGGGSSIDYAAFVKKLNAKAAEQVAYDDDDE